jgi:AraC-like DNA-binding protein
MRRIFRITAGQLIQKVRIDAALQRLRESDVSVAEIASACGLSTELSARFGCARSSGVELRVFCSI